jgi:hypothetical protein
MDGLTEPGILELFPQNEPPSDIDSFDSKISPIEFDIREGDADWASRVLDDSDQPLSDAGNMDNSEAYPMTRWQRMIRRNVIKSQCLEIRGTSIVGISCITITVSRRLRLDKLFS